jgi:hypothetical protein
MTWSPLADTQNGARCRRRNFTRKVSFIRLWQHTWRTAHSRTKPFMSRASERRLPFRLRSIRLVSSLTSLWSPPATSAGSATLPSLLSEGGAVFSPALKCAGTVLRRAIAGAAAFERHNGGMP